jgi:glycosyltransferase involved in cell wall biosynthesis
MVPQSRPHLVYVFERFPTFTQTFCVREILELQAQGIRPLIFSLRDTRDEPAQTYPAALREAVHYLPESEELTRVVRQLRTDRQLPKPVDHALRFWKNQPDKLRVYEAAWIGHRLTELAPGAGHAHCHFAGRAARTLWWLRNFFGLSYSFTAHANDVFCAEPDTQVTLPLLMRDAARIITVSDYTVNRLAQEYPGTRRKIRRVYNGLDLQPWKQAANGRPNGIGSRRIYSIGRLIEKKGFDDLIRASALLRDRGIAHTIHIIGGGPQESELRELIHHHELSAQVFLEGEWDQARIIQALAHEAHVFALACATEKDGGMDNLPTVLMEAMAVGLPCVSTRLAGVPEMVLEGETGLLTGEREPAKFADCLQTLLEDESLCRSYGANGHRLAQERFEQSATSRALQKALLSAGAMRCDLSVFRRRPDLVSGYLAGLPHRILRFMRRRPSFSAEDFLGGDNARAR